MREIWNVSDFHGRPYLESAFNTRCRECLKLIKASGLTYEEVGVYGVYARGEYGISSDIDICVVTSDTLNIQSLKQDLEDIGAKLICLPRDVFEMNQYIQRDYRRVL